MQKKGKGKKKDGFAFFHPFLHLSHSFFDFGDNGGENCDEFVGFFDERFRFWGWENIASYKQIKPVVSFV